MLLVLLALAGCETTGLGGFAGSGESRADRLARNGEHAEAASAIEAAVVQALGEGVTTQDLGGSARTGEVGDFLARAVASGTPQAVS